MLSSTCFFSHMTYMHRVLPYSFSCFSFISSPSPSYLLSSIYFFPHSFIPCCPSCEPLFNSEHQPEASLLLSNNITHIHPFPLSAHFFCCFYKLIGQMVSKGNEGRFCVLFIPGRRTPSRTLPPLIRCWLLVLADNLPWAVCKH